MNYQLHLFMYSMNLNTVKPFLFYYMLKKESYEFPKAFLDHSKFQKDEIGGTNEIKMKDEPFSILNLFSKSTSKEEEPEKVEDKEIDIEYIKIREWEEKFDKEQKLKEQEEMRREQRLIQKEMERRAKFDNIDNTEGSLSQLEKFSIDKSKKN